MTNNGAEVPDGATAPDEMMNAPAASCWQRRHVSDLWAAIKTFPCLATCGFKHGPWQRTVPIRGLLDRLRHMTARFLCF